MRLHSRLRQSGSAFGATVLLARLKPCPSDVFHLKLVPSIFFHHG